MHIHTSSCDRQHCPLYAHTGTQQLLDLDRCRKEGCNVHGYFVWSLLDNWEWNSGYTVRFGLYYIDYNNNLTRIPKASVKWFSQVLAQPQKTAIM